MDSEARRRACVEFRARLSRDTGVNLPAAVERMLEETFAGDDGEQVSLQSNPGRFYACLGAAIGNQTVALYLPDNEKVAWWCYREAAQVHKHPAGMGKLAWCLLRGQGVTGDPAQAAVWFQKAADLGDAAAKATLGAMLLNGEAGVAKDAARGFALSREAVDQGYGLALFQVARCYLRGEGVEKDAAHGVCLLRQVINQEDATKARAETLLTICYVKGNGVEADTVQAALLCQKAVTSGDTQAIEMLRLIRTCDFCSSRCGGAG